MFDPWFKATYPFEIFGHKLKLQVPHDVFSTLRIDEGTLLLLENLPSTEPKAILDMGCGYGALGLPVAARYPNTPIEMVDRDLLAVQWAAQNAQSNGLTNAHVYPSLGYRDLKTSNRPYDWILCNVPARIGRPFIEHLFEAGQKLLAPQGEIRVVVIRDLGPLVEELALEHKWAIRESARGPRHTIYALTVNATNQPQMGSITEPPELYARDRVDIAGLQLDRPFDISGDSTRLATALPVLIDALPKKAPSHVFCFRSSYGVLPLIARKRWPEAQVVATDRDLLGTTFARTNAARLGLEGSKFEVREQFDLCQALEHASSNDEHFDFAMGEISPSAGEKVAEAELVALSKSLTRDGQALILTLEKIEKEWIKGIAARRKLSISRLIARDGNLVLRLTSA